MEQKEIKYNGSRIMYRVKGSGMPVVLVHGFGEDGSIWKNQYDAFPDHKLIIPDLPGSGASGMIDDMSMEGLAAALERLIVHELGSVFYKQGEPGSVVMIGHSMGGYVSLAFAEKKPEMLGALGLFHSSANADSSEKKETRKKGIEFTREHGAFAFLKTATPNLYAQATKDAAPAKIEEHLDSIRHFSAEALVQYYEAMMARPDRTNVLKNTGLPVLFIFGRHDSVIPLEDGLQQSHLPQLSYIHLLENSGHMGMIEEAELANKYLSEYLDSVIRHQTS
jgi:pimeloyl-ACP methyl ester carboxylesterase